MPPKADDQVRQPRSQNTDSNANAATPSADEVSTETIGHFVQDIPIEMSTRFLEHFSEQLYSSPQKAFEELISNGWDAGADYVDVRVSADLNAPNATMCVLDNGTSMDASGLRQLWRLAFSQKKLNPIQNGRRVVGQFGIGKLATYVLANKLTYICRASDGIIRRVTMDYSTIAPAGGGQNENLLSDTTLKLYNVEEDELVEALSHIEKGDKILELIQSSFPKKANPNTEDEYNAIHQEYTHPTSGTWTLVILSELKPIGKELKLGVLRRMLSSSLPFGSEMIISVNDELLSSSKIEWPTEIDWTIGPDLNITNIEIEIEKEENTEEAKPVETDKDQPTTETINVRSGNTPVPYVEIDGIGRITGRVRLFKDSVTGGKSDERGSSNGFHVNVLGRVINQQDPSFGEKNLSHAAWSRFRMVVRADGLNEFLTTNREQFKERRELKIFRAFLRKVFNETRKHYDSDPQADLPHGGDVLVRSLGVLSLSPLRNAVTDALSNRTQMPSLFDIRGVDKEEQRRSWQENTAENIKEALSQVKYERTDDDSFVKFRIVDNTMVVNREHPFVIEHSGSKAEKELVRTIAMVNLLTDMYALEAGISAEVLSSVRNYRDKLLRYKALQSRRSGLFIANLLLKTQHVSNDSKRLEAVLADAFRYLGFDVQELAKPGEPEGIASAHTSHNVERVSLGHPTAPLYTVAFDAKTSKNEVAATGNLNLDGIKNHREKFHTTYSIVVAPGFQEGDIGDRCRQQAVTPMTAHDLGILLEYTVKYGAIPLPILQEVFSIFTPSDVNEWVVALERRLQTQRELTIDKFLSVLDVVKNEQPDAVGTKTILMRARQMYPGLRATEPDVKAVVEGLAILVPDLIALDNGDVIVNASAERVAAAVRTQLEILHKGYPAED